LSGVKATIAHVSIAEFPSNGSRQERGQQSTVGVEFERTPPQDLQAEQSVLGGMLLSKDAIADVVEVLRSRDFYRPAHELIFEAILDLYGRGEPADAITVSAELTKRGEIARAGGAPYLHTLISSVPTAANASYYAKIVLDHAIMRRLVEAGTKVVQLGYDQNGEVDDAVDAAQAEIYAVTERRSSEDYVQLNTLLPQALDEIEAISKGAGVEGVMTGFRELDKLTHGLHPGNMIIVAARPAVGKSTLGLDIARHASIHDNKAAVIFSLEMSKSEITMRMLSSEARVGLNNIRSGQLSDDEWAKLARRMGEISDAPLFIDDSPNLSMMEIRAKARRLKQRHDLKLIVIDYLQLMTSGKRVENRQQEVSDFSRQIKLMAKELDVPVIAISQLNRGPEQRTDKKPMLSDLRESGSIEQDADVVILLHREDMYDSQNRAGEADLIVAKHRNGPTRTITVSAQLHFARFFDMADAQQPRNWNEPASVPVSAPAGYVPDSPYGDQQPAESGDGGWNE
jgi:replicative DNA helicase